MLDRIIFNKTITSFHYHQTSHNMADKQVPNITDNQAPSIPDNQFRFVNMPSNNPDEIFRQLRQQWAAAPPVERKYNIYKSKAKDLKEGDYVMIADKILPILRIEMNDDGKVVITVNPHPRGCQAVSHYDFLPDDEVTCAFYI